MTFELIAVMVAAGAGAGVMNTLVGAGSLITFPVLLAAGYPAITAGMINQLGLLPGTVSGAYGYRRRLPRGRPFLIRLCLIALVGAVIGGGLLVVLPAYVFAAMAPFCVLAAAGMVAAHPLLVRRARPPATTGSAPSPTESAPGTDLQPADHPANTVLLTRTRPERTLAPAGRPHSRLLWLGVAAAGVYAGWIGISLGVVILAVLIQGLPGGDLQQLNAVKMLLASVAGLTAASLYLLTGHTGLWVAALAVGSGNLAGGWIGALVAQRLNQTALRVVMVTVGVASGIVAL